MKIIKINRAYCASWVSLLITCILSVTGQVYAATLPDFTPLVEKNGAAVVNISTTFKKESPFPGRQHIPDIPEDSPFYEFFKKYFGELPEGTQPYHERSSLGSGFIISKDGHIITNNHVVKDADEIVVRLNDRREYIAEIIGTDERSDIAVLKIDGEHLPAVQIGNSDQLKVGEWVLAIGSPFGFDHSVTAGIVSAKGRPLPNENYVPFIQTDVAINPGNSGGPLFNLDGQVIGVNSQIYSRTGGFMGLSFAVPINLVVNVYQQIRDQGHVSRGWLGVLIQDVTRELAESFGMKKPHGALIAKILPDSPAEKAGFEIGDVVVSYNGNEVGFSSDLPPMVGSSTIGSTVPVEVIRRGKKRTVQVTISALPENDEMALGGNVKKEEAGINRLNIIVKDLTDKQLGELNIDHGILVEKVMAGAASKAGIRSGDIILILNNEKIANVEGFEKLIKALPAGKSIPILVQRRGNPIFLALKLGDDEGQ